MTIRFRTVIRDCLQPVLRPLGFELLRLSERLDLFSDIGRFLATGDLMVFDVGGNEGQSVQSFEEKLPNATIHSFEPGPGAFEKLKQVPKHKKTYVWNLALGSTPGQLSFHENVQSEMSSFLPLGERGWGKVGNELMVTVTTVDQFCAEHRIERIDVLKSDTQGFDFEVFKGAKGMLEAGRIGLIYFEVNFSEIYQGAPHFEEIFRFLNQYDFQLQRLYGIGHVNQAIWTDALFVHKRYLPK
jgi:FkbM family methyltransferase